MFGVVHVGDAAGEVAATSSYGAQAQAAILVAQRQFPIQAFTGDAAVGFHQVQMCGKLQVENGCANGCALRFVVHVYIKRFSYAW